MGGDFIRFAGVSKPILRPLFACLQTAKFASLACSGSLLSRIAQSYFLQIMLALAEASDWQIVRRLIDEGFAPRCLRFSGGPSVNTA